VSILPELPRASDAKRFAALPVRRELELALWLTGTLILACIPLDLFLLGGLNGDVLRARLGWGLSSFATGYLFGRCACDRDQRIFGAVGIALNYGYLFAVVVATGKQMDLYVHWIFILPYVVILLTRGDAPLAVVNIVAFMVSAPWFLGEDLGVSTPAALASAAPMVLVLVVIAFVFRRMRLADEHMEEERRRIEEADRRSALSQRMALVGQLAAGVAHEVNNPLAYVKSNVEQLQLQLKDARHEAALGADLKEMIDDTLTGVQRIQHIVASLRGFARDESKAAQVCEVKPAIAESLQLASVRLHTVCEVTQVLPAAPVFVRANEQRLIQVLVNLLVNAADALEETRGKWPAQLRIEVKELGERVRIAVEDNGPGIAPDVLPRMFEPFFTTKPRNKGTGLGLSLVRDYVERQGGTLGVENVSPHGARFVVDLPRAERKPISLAGPAAPRAK